MRLAWMAWAALGLSAVVPTFAMADGWRDRRDDSRFRDRHDARDRYDARDRRDYRDVRVVRERVVIQDDCRDFDTEVTLRDVPRAVLETADCERHGRRIESVQYVRRDGKLFYRVRLDDPSPRDRDMNLRIQPGGRLLSIQEAEACDPVYFRR